MSKRDRRRRKVGCIYLLCFDRPYKHARHYLGFAAAATPDERIAEHRAGTGARLLAVVAAAGIGWTVARVWKGATRTDERALKNQKNTGAKLCPVCRAAKKAALACAAAN
jgi:predicted GIY-YIG superfamily endonuclease